MTRVDEKRELRHILKANNMLKEKWNSLRIWIKIANIWMIALIDSEFTRNFANSRWMKQNKFSIKLMKKSYKLISLESDSLISIIIKQTHKLQMRINLHYKRIVFDMMNLEKHNIVLRYS